MNSPVPKKRKIRTLCHKCNDKVNPTMKMIGTCKYCEYIFCGEHRLPETHSCSNQEKCNEKSFNDNSKKNNVSSNFKKVIKI